MTTYGSAEPGCRSRRRGARFLVMELAPPCPAQEHTGVRQAREQRPRETGAEKGHGFKSWPWKIPYMLKSVMWF